MRRWLGNPENPKGIRTIKKLFDKFYPSAFAETTEENNNRERQLPELSDSESETDDDTGSSVFRVTAAMAHNLQVLLGTHSVKLRKRIAFKGVIFSTWEQSNNILTT